MTDAGRGNGRGAAGGRCTLADRGRIVPELGRLRVLVLAVVDGRRSLEDALLERLIWVEGQEQ